jgi:hypothetical protein
MDTLKLRLTELVDASFDESKLAVLLDKLQLNNMMLNELKLLKNDQNRVLAWYLHASKLIS